MLEQIDYRTTYLAMQQLAQQPKSQLTPQLWYTEHPPVYTLGRHCKEQPKVVTDIPIVQTNRGGQITYHGPGQLMIYPILHLPSIAMGVKDYVDCLEQSVIDLLALYDIQACRQQDKPGVYVNQHKIASIGIRIKHGIAFHGMALNVKMDLTPFDDINPCGYAHLSLCQLSDFCSPPPWQTLIKQHAQCLSDHLPIQIKWQSGSPW